MSYYYNSPPNGRGSDVCVHNSPSTSPHVSNVTPEWWFSRGNSCGSEFQQQSSSPRTYARHQTSPNRTSGSPSLSSVSPSSPHQRPRKRQVSHVIKNRSSASNAFTQMRDANSSMMSVEEDCALPLTDATDEDMIFVQAQMSMMTPNDVQYVLVVPFIFLFLLFFFCREFSLFFPCWCFV